MFPLMISSKHQLTSSSCLALSWRPQRQPTASRLMSVVSVDESRMMFPSQPGEPIIMEGNTFTALWKWKLMFWKFWLHQVSMKAPKATKLTSRFVLHIPLRNTWAPQRKHRGTRPNFERKAIWVGSTPADTTLIEWTFFFLLAFCPDAEEKKK